MGLQPLSSGRPKILAHVTGIKVGAASSMASSSAQICCARVSFDLAGVGAGAGLDGLSPGVVVVVAVVLVLSLVRAMGFLFFRHSRAMWPCSRHRKQRPSLASCARSLGVSHLNGVALAASTSIGTMPEFDDVVLEHG